MRWDDETHGTTDANEIIAIREGEHGWCVFTDEEFRAGLFPSCEKARQWVEVHDAVTRPAAKRTPEPSESEPPAADPRIEAIAKALYEQEVALMTKVARQVSEATGFVVPYDPPHWKKTNKKAKTPHRRTAAKLVAALDKKS
jgi:hypothetical protein